MEQSFGREYEAPIEREPQVEDVVAAARQVISELAPNADPTDVEIVLSELEAATDDEEAKGIAVGGFAMLDIDYDAGLAMLGEILQVEAILPNGDQNKDAD